ncbi:hypothetical protein ALC57_10100 [Trachymyrmex cornetzi]|uniref:Uncharacterized protein n=1 Tax=Trachymyrmex cornetzi TaxID=471704 RepID=A0A195DY35_9HYME|nr:hypothetical protein ALC57_10100 [Trachymyrmex cornetzi]
MCGVRHVGTSRITSFRPFASTQRRRRIVKIECPPRNPPTTCSTRKLARPRTIPCSLPSLFILLHPFFFFAGDRYKGRVNFFRYASNRLRSYQERPNNAPGQSVGRDRQENPKKDYTREENKREERRRRDEEQRAEFFTGVHNRYLSRYFVNNFRLSLACCDSYHQVFSLHSAFSPFPSLYHSGRDEVRCLMKARERQRGWWSFGSLDGLPRCNPTINVSKHKNMNLSRRVVRARGGKKGTERREGAALIICTRTSLLSCGRRTRPLQLWHSALPRLQPSCSTRIPFESGYSTNRLHPSRTSSPLPLPLSTHLFFFPYRSLQSYGMYNLHSGRRSAALTRNLETGEARSNETLKQTTSHTRSHTSSPAVFSGRFLPSPTRSRCVLWSCKIPPETQDSPISEGALRTAIQKERYLEMNRKISNLKVHQGASKKSRVWTK